MTNGKSLGWTVSHHEQNALQSLQTSTLEDQGEHHGQATLEEAQACFGPLNSLYIWSTDLTGNSVDLVQESQPVLVNGAACLEGILVRFHERRPEVHNRMSMRTGATTHVRWVLTNVRSERLL